ncbi:HAMP domain-containing sensor histidine kinase [Rhizobium sp. LC145]|uniref:sensor histidine kinase n=1 Tax=Rhizobium sp. LC145 TaxID=1120688 RepID=UPI00062A3F1E|nr:HAMP domain-containing sensor histidine kinase [Rhizobium sp. LC145]KKX23864.1 histidine kinase [Rhizobium sp. LC145]TKT67089.1 HAMP domain-containing histidine kinase [Rhizobiaceae bacterium LC148]
MGVLRDWIRRSRWLTVVCALFTSAITAAEASEFVERVPRVLVLYPYDERVAATTVAGEAVRARLLEATGGKIDLFSEFLDLARFPEVHHVDHMAQFLAEKYSNRQPDIVIALGEQSAKFIATHRTLLAKNARIIVAGFNRTTALRINLPDDVLGVFTEFDILKTAQMAQHLQPDAHHLFIIGGSSDFDRWWLDTARAGLASFAKNYKTTYLENLTIAEFAAAAAAFPPDSIVLVLTIFKDRSGRNFIPRDAVKQIAADATAPIYGPYATYIDSGIVGGNVVTFESLGSKVADLSLDVLGGKPVDHVDAPHVDMVDARQLERWGLSEKRLPPGTVQMFRQPTFLEQYWISALVTLAIVATQSIAIAVLLVERRRRRLAEKQSRSRLLEVIHLNQSATAGALSASIAHELNQPLGAIRSNAEAASSLLRSSHPDLKLIEQILIDIQDDDQRAHDIILRMRGLLKKRAEIDWQRFDLNELTTISIKILQGEASRRGISVTSNPADGALPIRADKVHIQQVILNIAMNAMDAMHSRRGMQRKLMLETRLTKDSKAELSISDSGHGIPENLLSVIFDPFYTTKVAGTGLGLSIARTIVHTYGGEICAANRCEGGAVFRVKLPLAEKG